MKTKRKRVPPLRMRTGKDLLLDILCDQFKPETETERQLADLVKRLHGVIDMMEEEVCKGTL